MRAWRLSAIVLLCLAGPARGHDAAPSDQAGIGPLSIADARIYAEAFHLADAGRFDRALERARDAEDPLPAKVLHWLALSEPAPGVRFNEAAAFLDHSPEWPGLAGVQRNAELAMPADWPVARVRAWFAARPPITVEGTGRYAAALLAAGEEARAAVLVRTAWIEQDLAGAEESAFRARFAKLLRRADEVARLDRLLWDRQYRPAKRQARRLGGGYPALVEARLVLAQRGPGVDWAIKRVPKELANDPGLIFERAQWRQRRGDYEGVIELLDPPIPGAPRAERWWALRHWAARQALARGDVSVAYRIASGHGLETGAAFAEGEWLAGWIALRFLGQPEGSYQHFKRLRDEVTTPVSLARAAYWAGEAARAIDEKEPAGHWYALARQWYTEAAAYPTTFYGQLGALRLGWRIAYDPTSSAPPDAAARAAFEARELVRVVRRLGQLGETELHRRFLARLSVLAETAADYTLVAELATTQDRPDVAMHAARAARSEGVLLPAYLFPVPPLPEAEAPEPALVLAVIRQESGFYPRAVSHAGARGLMQLLPHTARRVARRINLLYSPDKLVTDPDYNLRLGRAYLADLTERYGGSYLLALAAYNAGPARADRWIREFGDPRDGETDPVDWIESIPFLETRNYVQRILEGLMIYRDRLGAEGAPALAPEALSPFRAWSRGEAPGDLSCCL